MTTTFWLWLGLLTGGAVLAFIGWALVAGGARRQADRGDVAYAAYHAPKAKRGPLQQHFCPYCHRAGVYMTKTGQPNRRYHQCDPAAVQAHVWPPAFVQTDEPQPPQTVTTTTSTPTTIGEWPHATTGAKS